MVLILGTTLPFAEAAPYEQSLPSGNVSVAGNIYITPYVLCSGGGANSIGTTANQGLVNCPINASTFGINGSALIESLWQYPNGSNTKNLFVQLGGINLATYAATTTNSYTSIQLLADSGTYQAQWTAPFTIGALSSNIANLSVNMAATTNISFAGNTSLATSSPVSNIICNGTACNVILTTPAANNFPTGTYIYLTGTNMTGANSQCANAVGTTGNSLVQATWLSATVFQFPWTNCAGGTTNTAVVGTAQPFSSLQLMQYQVVVYPTNP